MPRTERQITTEMKFTESLIGETPAKTGALWLDEYFPGWANDIDLKTFEITDSEACVCGQVFKVDEDTEDAHIDGYDYFIDKQDEVRWYRPSSEIDDLTYQNFRAEHMGFAPSKFYAEKATALTGRKISNIKGINLLQDEWVDLIRERQNNG